LLAGHSSPVVRRWSFVPARCRQSLVAGPSLMSSRTKWGTSVLACGAESGTAGKNPDPSLCSGWQAQPRQAQARQAQARQAQAQGL